MPYSLGRNKITSALLCEAIRTESGNKFSLLGVFVGDLNIPLVPANIMLSCFLEYIPDAAGKQQLLSRFVHNGKVVANINGELDVIVSSAPIAVALPTVPVLIDHAGVLGFEVSVDGKKWKRLIERNILLADVAISTTSSAPPL